MPFMRNDSLIETTSLWVKSGGNRMTREESYSTIGRVHSEKAEAEYQFALVGSEIRRLANVYARLAANLNEAPHHVIFTDQPFVTVLGPAVQQPFHARDFDVQKIKDLLTELKGV